MSLEELIARRKEQFLGFDGYDERGLPTDEDFAPILMDAMAHAWITYVKKPNYYPGEYNSVMLRTGNHATEMRLDGEVREMRDILAGVVTVLMQVSVECHARICKGHE